MKNKFLRAVLCSLYPNICVFCFKRLPFDKLICFGCKKLLPETVINRRTAGGYPCVSPLPYMDRFSDSIKMFKFKNSPQLAETLAKIVANRIKFDGIDVITYVPMFIKRERKRGYNQAKLLALRLSELVHIPCEDLLVKFKDNKEQHTLNQKERKTNVRGVYRAINQERIKGKRILLIDDIITTGNTLGECCRILTRAKAGRITCATVCAKIK